MFLLGVNIVVEQMVILNGQVSPTKRREIAVTIFLSVKAVIVNMMDLDLSHGRHVERDMVILEGG